MANWWKVGAIVVLAALLPDSAPAQFLNFGKKPQEDPPPAFSNGPDPSAAPEFAPDPRNVPKGAPDFCPPMGGAAQTPFVPVEEENRNAFLDYKHSEPDALSLWVKGEYLLWHVKNPSLATVLATTTPGAADLNTNFGALDQAGTQVLLGPGTYNYGTVTGGRVTGGIAPGFFFPVEISGFWLQKNLRLLDQASNGGPAAPVLARPVLATQIGQESVFLAGFPNEAAGNLQVNTSLALWGIDANIFLNFVSTDIMCIDFLAGYRYAELRESVVINNFLRSLDPNLVIPFNGDPNGFGLGFSTGAFDQFATRNQFNGGQIGVRTGLTFGRVGLFVDGKLALGQTTQSLDIVGTSSLATPATQFRGVTTVPGGVLALPSNIGHFTSDDFSIIPQLDVNAGFQLHRSIRLFAGFSIMYWNRVLRPGDQLNNIVDTRQAPTDFNFIPGFRGAEPQPTFNKSDFFAYGFNLGVLIGF